jgi:hypothetical protein
MKLLKSYAFLLLHACVGHLPLCWSCKYRVIEKDGWDLKPL